MKVMKTNPLTTENTPYKRIVYQQLNYCRGPGVFRSTLILTLIAGDDWVFLAFVRKAKNKNPKNPVNPVQRKTTL